jgi:hypothetical protein
MNVDIDKARGNGVFWERGGICDLSMGMLGFHGFCDAVS